MTDAEIQPGRRPRKRRWLRWLVGALLVICVGAALGIASLKGKEIEVPGFLRDKISSKINSLSDDVKVNFDALFIVVEDGWAPRLRLKGIDLRRANGAEWVHLSDIDAAVNMSLLLRGQIQPTEIFLSGGRLALFRTKEGAVNVALGTAGQTMQEAPTFVDLAKQLELFLERPALSSLQRIEANNLIIQYKDLRADRAWTVDGGRLTLTRAGRDVTIRGDFALLGGRDYATTIAMSYAGRIGAAAAEIGLSFDEISTHDIAGQSPALAWLDALDAPISGALRVAVDDAGNLGDLNATLQIGAGAVRPTEAAKPIAFNGARSYFTYNKKTQVITFDELSLDSNWAVVQADGQAQLVGMEDDGWPNELQGQFRLRDIRANPNDLYAEPVTLGAASLSMRLNLDPFVLSLGELSLSDGGHKLVLGGEISANQDGWSLAIDGHMDGLNPKRLLQLWPVSVQENTRNWLVDNVIDADLSNIQMAIRARPRQVPDFVLGFDFDRLSTLFVADVPPISEASGHATLYDNRLSITATKGQVVAAQGGAVDISGTSFVIPNVAILRGPAEVHLKTDSTITAALSLLDEAPFRFMQKAGQPVTLADGRALLTGRLDFLVKQFLQPEEVAFEATGILSAVRSDVLVKGRTLKAGQLELHADNTALTITGDAQLGQVPASGVWQSLLGPDSGGASRLTGEVELSQRFVDEFGIGLPPGSLSGVSYGDVVIDFVQGAPGRFQLASDLAGLGLRLPDLGWALAKSKTGVLNVTGTLGDPPAIDSLSISGAGLNAQGTVRLRPDGQLDRAVFSSVTLDNWINAPVSLIGRGAGQPPAIEVSGGWIDLRRTSLTREGGGGGSAGGSGGGPVKLALDRLQISDGIALTGFRADLDMRGGAKGNFSGSVNGKAPITGKVAPKENRSGFVIRSPDAGKVFSAAGFLKTAREGELLLNLVPVVETGTYDGYLKTTNLRIKDAPALATLLNAMSVVGIIEQLDGDGIHFGEVEARFRLTPKRVTLLSSSAVGASMGITMDGYYFMENGRMDMRGVLSPIYLVNAIGGIGTRRGEGLIGFKYRLKGAATSPSVEVNPLSVLTPGLFREIFRKPPPKVEGGVYGDTKPVRTQPKKDPRVEEPSR